MDDWVLKAMQRWPNVPALFGWLGLDRRGRWLIKGEPITHPRIVATINRNYGVDEHGRWYFQNGPQRGYFELENAPFILRRHREGFVTHNGLAVELPSQVLLDEEGSVLLSTEHGLGEIASADLDWVLERLTIDDQPLDEEALMSLLELPSGTETSASIAIVREPIHVVRLDAHEFPHVFGFTRTPQPLEGERTSTRAPD
jgi:hypothetical protein